MPSRALRRLITCAGAMAGVCLFSATASAEYSAQVLPPPGGFPANTTTRAFALNASGQVLGEAIPPGGQGRVPVLWTDNIATVLPIPPGYHWDDSRTSSNFLNDAGVAVSHVGVTGSGIPGLRDDALRVIVWNQGVPTIIDPPETGWAGRDFGGSVCSDYHAFPWGINASGQLLFSTGNADGSARCERIWLDTGGAFTVLPEPVGGTAFCRLVFVPVPHGLNDSAHVLLQIGLVAINAISNCNGVPAPAGILSGGSFAPLTTTMPLSLNNNDQILSWTSSGGPFVHLVDGANTADLGQGGYQALNDRGQVVFVSTAGGAFAPVMYQNGVSTNLLFPPNSGPGPGTGGGQPLLINSVGQIVSWTFALGFEQAVLLTPSATSLIVPGVTGTLGGTVTLSSTLTSLGQPLAGKTVTFVLNGVQAGTGVTDSQGNATLAGVPLGNLSVGVYPDAVQVVFDGAAGYGPSSASAALTVVPPALPVVSLKVNGQHPSPAVVTTTGPMTLTLDIAASAYTAPVSWYWALVVNGQVVWITSTGVKTAPAPLVVAPPVAIANAVLLNITLPQATTLTSVFFLVNGTGSPIAGDLITATRP